MPGKKEIRLGEVQCVYEEGRALHLHSVHSPEVGLTVWQADLPDLIRFIQQSSGQARDTVRLESVQKSAADQHSASQAGQAGEGSSESASPQHHP